VLLSLLVSQKEVYAVASDVLDAKEVAQMLKVSVRTVVRLAERGEIVAFKVGDLWRFHRSDIDDYIEEQKRKQQQREQ
jgi:excisionase family DNA binding protein